MGRVVGTTVIFTFKQHWKTPYYHVSIDSIDWENKDHKAKETQYNFDTDSGNTKSM